MAIMKALEEWTQYLIAVPVDQPFEIQTDHQNIVWACKPQNLERRQARWKVELNQYNYKITHLPGKQNTMADGLLSMT